MTFGFRIRFNLVGLTRIDDAASEWVLDSNNAVTLRTSTGESIADSQKLIVLGSGYETAESSAQAAASWVSILRTSFAARHIPADFGERNVQAGLFTAEALELASTAAGVSVGNDRRGVITYVDGEQPLLIGADAVSLTHGVPGKGTLEFIHRARPLDIQLPEEVRIAYDLYSFAMAEASSDARFVMLMMALETLIQQGQRPAESQALIEDLKSIVRESADVPGSERDSLERCIDELKREAVGKAGRRLAKTLRPRTYLDMSAVSFFESCYKLRSLLVHGYSPRPSIGEISRHLTPLQQFVSDLIVLPFITTDA